MSETSDNEKHLLDMSPNVKIITALIVGLLLGAWANDEFDEPKGKFEFMVGGDMLWKVDEKNGDAWKSQEPLSNGWQKVGN